MFTSRKIKKNLAKQPDRYSVLGNTGELTDKLTRDTSKRLRYGVLVVLGLILLGYLSFQVFKIMAPPELVIEQPQTGLVVGTKLIVIRGFVEPESELRVNNEVVLTKADGSFRQEISLQEGPNILVFMAKKRFSRVREIEIQVFFKLEPVVKGKAIEFTN